MSLKSYSKSESSTVTHMEESRGKKTLRRGQQRATGRIKAPACTAGVCSLWIGPDTQRGLEQEGEYWGAVSGREMRESPSFTNRRHSHLDNLGLA